MPVRRRWAGGGGRLRTAASDAPSGPARRNAIIAKKPRLKIPSRSRPTNHALLSSCQVFSRAPIQATKPAIRPPGSRDRRRARSGAGARRARSPCSPTMSGPFMTNTSFAIAIHTATIARMAPAMMAMPAPMKSLVTVVLDMMVVLSVCRMGLGLAVRPAASRRSGRHGDRDLAAGVAPPDVVDRLRGLAQRVGTVDDGRDLAGLDERP